MLELKDISPLNVLHLDDHLMFLQGIAELLQKIAPHCRVDLFTSSEKAELEMEGTQYQFILIDLMIPGFDVGEFISHCKKKYPSSFIIIISSVIDLGTIKRLFVGGIHGYLSKSVNAYELKTALEKIYHGERYISTDISGKMATSFIEEGKTDLTKKELEVLRMVAAGKSVVQTASTLLISPSTVMAHRRNIMGKLGLHSAAELVRYAYENKLM